MSLHRRHPLVWLLALALLLTAALPAGMRHAPRESGAMLTAAFCSTSGQRALVVDTAPVGDDTGATHADCHWCCAHPAQAAPPPRSLTPALITLPDHWLPERFRSAPRLHAWVAASPRGPPARA